MQERAGHLKEQGFASIIIAIVLVLILSLITVGFADLMRREQKSALNKHLSNQAYYAAESGINDAAKAINAGYTAAKTTCDTTGVVTTQTGSQYLMHPDVGTDSSVTYSCLLINPRPQTLEFGAITDATAKVLEVSGVDAGGVARPIGSMVISWQESTPSGASVFANPPSGPLPLYTNDPATSDKWTATIGVLRIGVTPLQSGGINRNFLSKSTAVSYMYPNQGTTDSNPGSGYSNSNLFLDGNSQPLSGTFSRGNCTNNSKPLKCNVRFTIASNVQANYLLDLRSYYRDSHVSVSAYATDGSQLYIMNAQTIVDSTGRAQDVLRRIQARIPSKNNYDVPPNSLSVVGGICKQLELYPTTGTNKCTE